MAGSWNHTVDRETGQLRECGDLLGMLETRSGDVYEYAEEAYGMVWWLASKLEEKTDQLQTWGPTAAEWVEQARQNYREGLKRSPGIAEEGSLEDGEPEEFEPQQGQWVVTQGVGRSRMAKVVKRVRLSFDTYRIYLWDHDKLRLGKTLETYNVRFLRPATTADLNRYRVPEEDR